MKKWLLVLAALVSVSVHAAALFSEDFEQGLSKRWEPVKFEGKTEYSVIKDRTNSVLQARAASSASGLGTKVDVPLKKDTTFTWRWKIDKTPPGGSEDAK